MIHLCDVRGGKVYLLHRYTRTACRYAEPYIVHCEKSSKRVIRIASNSTRLESGHDLINKEKRKNLQPSIHTNNVVAPTPRKKKKNEKKTRYVWKTLLRKINSIQNVD